MSITIIQKSDLSRPKRNPRVALVLAGGAISGGVFKLGGLMALDRFLKNRKVTEFDIYIGTSAGSFLGSFIAGGIPPQEILAALNGTSLRFTPFRSWDFYWPAWRECVQRARRLATDSARSIPSIVSGLARYLSGSREQVRRQFGDALTHPGYSTIERFLVPLIREATRDTPLPQAGRYVPAGLFDNARLEQYVRVNLTRNCIPNDFRMLQKERGVSLYITATNLNTARGVVFGHDADHTVSISEAVQASTAIPGFYVPPRIRGEEYMDASVRKTANTSLAMHKGADLIIAYNPLRPFMNRNRYQLNPTTASLSELGFGTVVDQAIRTMLQTRLYLGIDRLRRDPEFKGDLILIEPQETDAEFFSMNPLSFWTQESAARHGYNSVRRALEQNFVEVQRILGAYGLDCDVGDLGADLDFSRPAANATPRSAPGTATAADPRPGRRARLSIVK